MIFLSSALLFLASQQSTITLPPGYYTLDEVAAQCTKQGTPVKADAVCANDLYALSIHELSWPELRSALVADERLSLSERNGTWMISRLHSNTLSEAAMWSRYWTFTLDTVQKVFGQTAEICQRIAAMPESARDDEAMAYAKKKSTDYLEQACSQLIYLVMAEHDQMYMNVGLPAFLSFPKYRQPFGTSIKLTYDQIRYVIDPAGNLTSFARVFGIDPSTAEGQEGVRLIMQMQADAKLIFEPASGSIGSLFHLSVPVGPKVKPTGGRSEVSIGTNHTPTVYNLMVPPDAVLSKKDLDTFKTRETTSKAEQEKPVANENWETIPDARMSLEFLNWARQSNENLIYYVSPFTDFRVNPSAKLSVTRLLQAVNDPKFTEYRQGPYINVMAGTYDPVDPPPALQLPSKLTLSHSGNVYVLRNELRFMDSICATSTAPSSDALNKLLNKGRPPLVDIATHVNDLKFNNWRHSNYSKLYFDFCDPLRFKPFASAIMSSPAFLAMAKAALEGNIQTENFNKLDQAAKEKIKAGILEVSTKIGGRGPYDDIQRDPLLVCGMIEDGSFENAMVQIKKQKGVLIFEIIYDQAVIWKATVSNVDPN